ncbi:MAG: alpha/beta hydrolase [Myxococcota bacterium]
MAANWDHRRIELSEVTLHAVVAGDGPLVVLLHGFPEFWYTWRHQIPALVEAGFRVVAPDQRGYNTSDKPEGIRPYRTTRLARDISELVTAMGEDRATLVGHDWGGAVAWAFAMQHPEQLERLVVANAPHPVSMARALRRPQQLLKSWYVGMFQLPSLPEGHLRRDDFAALREIFATTAVRADAYPDDDVQRYVEALSQPGCLTAALNYYRALRFGSGVEHRRVEAPVLVVWGEHDTYLGAEAGRPDAEWAPNLRFEPVEDASHWVQVDAYERVNELLVDFLTEDERG